MAHPSNPSSPRGDTTAAVDSNFEVRAQMGLSIWIGVALLAMMATTLCGCGGSSTQAAAESLPAPTPALTPEEVVRIQVESLREQNEAGIETVYRFASPDNRLATGPLSRFAGLFATPSYRALLESKEVEYYEMEVDGDSAMQVVTLTNGKGVVSFYLFQLSRQPDGSYEGCWMTDSVAPGSYRMGPKGESISNY